MWRPRAVQEAAAQGRALPNTKPMEQKKFTSPTKHGSYELRTAVTAFSHAVFRAAAMP